jgi:hypothetical protein
MRRAWLARRSTLKRLNLPDDLGRLELLRQTMAEDGLHGGTGTLRMFR